VVAFRLVAQAVLARPNELRSDRIEPHRFGSRRTLSFEPEFDIETGGGLETFERL